MELDLYKIRPRISLYGLAGASLNLRYDIDIISWDFKFMVVIPGKPLLNFSILRVEMPLRAHFQNISELHRG
jgi:hypothetical protein